MLGENGSGGGRKQKLGSSYLTRPRFGTFRGLYANRPLSRPLSYGLDKKKKLKKPVIAKMDFKKTPDYADTAYKEAVSRLRILLAESYTPIKRPYHLRELDSAGEETDNQSLLSYGSRASRFRPSYYYSNLLPHRRYHYPTVKTTYNVAPDVANKNTEFVDRTETTQKWESHPSELMAFVERQEEYIEQLEKESRFCRDELSTLLSKVKEVISENENLHERQKANLLKSVFDHFETETETEADPDFEANLQKSSKKVKPRKTLEGPAIVFESRISELEAQLTQTKIDLRKAQDENESFKRKLASGTISDGSEFDISKKQIDSLQREKATLQDTVNKLQNALSQLRNKENENSDQVKRSLDVAEQASYEKSAAEHEIRRLKDELERQHGKLREAITDQGRRVAEERNAVERRYSQQIEQLTTELGVQWETASKLQLELDKQRRENSDLRRELSQKQTQIDEIKKEMQNKIANMQADIGLGSAEKSALEHQIASLQLLNERNERQSKQEIARLHAEMQSLRQRLDRADADLIHSRRENIRLNEQVASLEKEINLNIALTEERSKRKSNEALALPASAPTRSEDKNKELPLMIREMENKHAATVAELEDMIRSQNQLMDKLSNECHVLTQKLEDASNRHKDEIRNLQSNLDYLSNRFSQSQLTPSNTKDEGRNSASNQRNPATTANQNTTDQHRPIARTNSNASVKSPYTPQHNKMNSPIPKEQTTPHGQLPDEAYAGQEQTHSTYQEYPAGETPAAEQDYSTTDQYQNQQEYFGDQYNQYDPNQQYDPQYQTDQNYADQQEYEQYNPDANAGYTTDPQYQEQPETQFTGNEQYDTTNPPVETEQETAEAT